MSEIHTVVCDKRDDFYYPIVNFPYLSSNIPDSSAYGVFASQLIRYARACSKYDDFLFRRSIQVSKLLKHGYYLHGKFRLLFGNSMVIIQTLFTHLTLVSVSHMLKGFFTNCDM